MPINPKSVNSAISPVQKSEIERKTVKLKMIHSSYKIFCSLRKIYFCLFIQIALEIIRLPIQIALHPFQLPLYTTRDI